MTANLIKKRKSQTPEIILTLQLNEYSDLLVAGLKERIKETKGFQFDLSPLKSVIDKLEADLKSLLEPYKEYFYLSRSHISPDDTVHLTLSVWPTKEAAYLEHLEDIKKEAVSLGYEVVDSPNLR